MNNGIMKYSDGEKWLTIKQNEKEKKFLNYYHAEKRHTICARRTRARAPSSHHAIASPFIARSLFISPIWLNGADRVRRMDNVFFCAFARSDAFCCSYISFCYCYSGAHVAHTFDYADSWTANETSPHQYWCGIYYMKAILLQIFANFLKPI